MLLTRLTHPDILRALARAGHGSLILIADANFPAATARGPNAELVHLNLTPGLVGARELLDVILSAVPVEQSMVMAGEPDGPWQLEREPPIWADFRAALARHRAAPELEAVERHAFYALARTPDVALTIASGETALYANIFLRIGVVDGQRPSHPPSTASTEPHT
jgi:L-fucose mutarotase